MMVSFIMITIREERPDLVVADELRGSWGIEMEQGADFISF